MSTKDKHTRLPRRAFLKGTAVGAAALAGGSVLAACGPKTATPTPEAPTANPLQPTQAATGPSFEVAPPPIDAADIKQTVTADVVVVGAGVSGLYAALSAAEAGAKTILIEKSATFNARGGHNAALGSRLQKAQGIEYDPLEVVRQLTRWGSNQVDQRLLMLWAQNCNATIDKLIDLAEAEGLEVTTWGNDVPDQYWGEYKTVHMFGGMDEKNVAGLLERAGLAQGVDIRYEMPAAQLLRTDGRVTGVIAGTAGNYTQFDAAKGVILSTGDYGNNPEMLKRYCPKALDVEMNVYAPAVNTGDGHRMGLWAGAAMQEEEPHTPMVHNLGAGPLTSHPFLRINKLGERYENEDVPIPLMANAIQLQPGNISWTIFDSTFAEDVPHLGVGFSRSPVVSEGTLAGLETALDNGTLAFEADTLAELAAKIGVPAEAFEATVARYNEVGRQGVDLDFGKSPEMLTAIDTPPFYASKNALALLVVLGGLKVNPKLQVLDAAGQVIPGLYASGNVVGGMFANDYPVIVPGLSHSRALTFGRIAGQNAAAG